tara:strand:+ start:833 stop:1225 length:393 start_codon:yes stop_codon:yes gene_type:complete
MSTLKVNTIQNTSGGSSSTPEQIEQGRAKAWIHFDGQDTVAIRDSFNVSTLTDNGTGDYTISFTSAMANTNYAVATTQPAQHNFTQAILGVEQDHTNAFATGSIRVQSVKTGNNSAVDRDVQCVVIFGDQ